MLDAFFTGSSGYTLILILTVASVVVWRLYLFLTGVSVWQSMQPSREDRARRRAADLRARWDASTRLDETDPTLQYLLDDEVLDDEHGSENRETFGAEES